MAIKAVSGLLRRLGGYKSGLYPDPGVYSDQAADVLKRLARGETIQRAPKVKDILKGAYRASDDNWQVYANRQREIQEQLAKQKAGRASLKKHKREIKKVTTKVGKTAKKIKDPYAETKSGTLYERQNTRHRQQVNEWADSQHNKLNSDAGNQVRNRKDMPASAKQKFIKESYPEERKAIEAARERALVGAGRPKDLPPELAEQQHLPMDWEPAGLRRAPTIQHEAFPVGRGTALPLDPKDSRQLELQLGSPHGPPAQAPRPKGLPPKDTFGKADVEDMGGYTTRTSPSGAVEIQEKTGLAGQPIYGGRLARALPGVKQVRKGKAQLPVPGMARLGAPTPRQASLLEPRQADLLESPTRLRDPEVIPSQPVLDEVAPSPRHETTPRGIPKVVDGRNTTDFFMSSNEYNAIKAAMLEGAANPAHYQRLVLFDLLATTGLRNKSVRLLRVKDIDFANKRITIRPETAKAGKGTKAVIGDEDLPITDELAEELRTHLNNRLAQADGALDVDDFVFVTKDRKPFRKIADPVRKAGESIGLTGLTPHALRHFSATSRALGGATDEAIRNALLHTDTGTAAAYYFPKNFQEILRRYARSRGIDIDNIDPKMLADRLRRPGADVLPDDIYHKLANLPPPTARSQAMKAGIRARALTDLEKQHQFLNPISQQVRRAAGSLIEEVSPEQAQANVVALTKYYDELAVSGKTTERLRKGALDPTTGAYAQLENIRREESLKNLEGDWVTQLQMHYNPAGKSWDGKKLGGGQYKALAESSELLPTDIKNEVMQAAAEAITAHGGSVEKILRTAKGREAMKVFVGHLGQREVFRQLSLTLAQKYGRIVKAKGAGKAERLTTDPDLAEGARQKVDELQRVIKNEPSSPIGGDADVAGYTGEMIRALGANSPAQFKKVFDNPRNRKVLKDLGKITASLLLIASAMQMPEGMMG